MGGRTTHPVFLIEINPLVKRFAICKTPIGVEYRGMAAVLFHRSDWSYNTVLLII